MMPALGLISDPADARGIGLRGVDAVAVFHAPFARDLGNMGLALQSKAEPLKLEHGL